MTDRQQQVIAFIESYQGEDECTANAIINKFRNWFPNDTAENLGLFLTRMVKHRMIEVVDGRYRVYDATAHGQDVPVDDNQLKMF